MLKLHVCMRPCKLDANKIQFHELSSHVYTHCENKRGLSHRHSLTTDWIWDEQTDTRNSSVHVETQVPPDNENDFHLLNIEYLPFDRRVFFFSRASYDGTGSIHDCTAMIHREIIVFCFSREMRLFSAISRGHGARWRRGFESVGRSNRNLNLSSPLDTGRKLI